MNRYKIILKNDSMTMAGFLDMMRYDRATITGWTYGAGASFIVEVEAPASRNSLTVDRWHSFGLNPRPVMS